MEGMTAGVVEVEACTSEEGITFWGKKL